MQTEAMAQMRRRVVISNTWLVQATGNKAAPVYYIMFAAAVGLAGLSVYRRPASSPAATAPQPAE